MTRILNFGQFAKSDTCHSFKSKQRLWRWRQTYVLATEAIAVVRIRRHLWLPLKPLCIDKGDHRRFTNVACNRQIDQRLQFLLETRGYFEVGQRPNRTDWSPGFLDQCLKRWNCIWQTFPQLTPLNLMRIQAGACWIWKKKPKSKMPQI